MPAARALLYMALVLLNIASIAVWIRTAKRRWEAMACSFPSRASAFSGQDDLRTVPR